MATVPSDVLLERVSRAIECHPPMTKTALTRLVKGTKQDVLRAIGALIASGYVQTTPGERGPALFSVRPYRPDPAEPACSYNGEETSPEPTEKPSRKPVSATNGKPVANHNGSGQTGRAGSTKDREVRHTPNGEVALVTEPRCRICRHGGARQTTNRMLAEGYSLAACLQGLAAINSTLPPKSKITIDSLRTHRARHFDLQAGASSVWRALMEERAEAEGADYERGVVNLVTPRIYLETIVAKSYAGLASGTAEIGPELGLHAARELHKVIAADAGTDQMARIVATQNRIIAAFRDLPAPYQQQVLDAVDGRVAPPRGGARLALVEASPDDDSEPDPFDDDGEDFGDDD